jgi:hypothetical protein
VVLGTFDEVQLLAGVPLVRRFWVDRKGLAFFGGGRTLLAAAKLVAPEAPGEVQGVVSDPQGPSAGAIDEFVDALAAQPDCER